MGYRLPSWIPHVGYNEPDSSHARNFTVLQKYVHIRLEQNLLRSTTFDIITRLLDNAAFVCVHLVGRFSKDFSEVRG